MNATRTTLTRPTLDVEAKARRNCRNNLLGMGCTDADGQVRTIADTTWGPGTVLLVSFSRGGSLEPASRFTLVGRWPFKCCRGRLGVDGFPKQRGAN